MSDAAPIQLLREKFIGGMSHAASTVNIVTTDGPGGRAGVTVSAMSSVSADTPRPTLLVCVHDQSPAAAMIINNGAFCVNVLRDDQGYISDTFAGRFKDSLADKFDCAEWQEMPSGAPRVVDPLVAFDCSVVSAQRVGTHHVIFGEVGDIFIAGRGSPLIYANRAYGAASRIDSAGTVATGRAAENTRLNVACFHTFGPYILPEMIQRLSAETPNFELALVEGDQRRVQESLLSGESEVGLLYDIDLGDGLDTAPLTQLEPYVLLAEGHPLAEESELTPQDMADHPMILLDAPPSRDYFVKIMRDAGVEPRVAFRSSHLEMVRGMVGHGLGYSILATKPASAMSYDGRALVHRALSAKSEPSHVVLATRKGATVSESAERFIWFCRDFFDLHH